MVYCISDCHVAIIILSNEVNAHQYLKKINTLRETFKKLVSYFHNVASEFFMYIFFFYK